MSGNFKQKKTKMNLPGFDRINKMGPNGFVKICIWILQILFILSEFLFLVS
jgi:hypothetical protein